MKIGCRSLDYLRNACVCLSVCLSVCHRPLRDCHLRFVAIREKIVACEARGQEVDAAAAAFLPAAKPSRSRRGESPSPSSSGEKSRLEYFKHLICMVAMVTRHPEYKS